MRARADATARVLTFACLLVGCGGGTGDGEDGGGTGDGEDGGASGTGGAGGTGAAATSEDVTSWVDQYQAAHTGSDGDITQKTAAELAADPDAARIRALCGDDQMPVIPRLTWEYGGSDHAWIAPEASALVYCVYTPVAPSTDHWAYAAGDDHVIADIYVLFPDDNPCKDEAGADQVVKCIGDPSNFEILVDTASLHDGHNAGLELSESSTDLNLVLADGEKVHLFHGD